MIVTLGQCLKSHVFTATEVVVHGETTGECNDSTSVLGRNWLITWCVGIYQMCVSP
jgi:hypothetical protein